jgi:uncharacterized protein with HEPN domain
MNREEKKYLFDLQTAGNLVLKFAQGKTFDDYASDDLLRSGIERQLCIVGEALTQLRNMDDELIDTLPNAHKAIGFRNILIHGYFAIDDAIVWEVVQFHPPDLLDRVNEMIDR